MESGRKSLEKRRKPRQTRRLSCELWIAGKRHSAFVKDVSEIGLYVQTYTKIPPGTEFLLVFPAAGKRPEVRVPVRVARTDRIQARMAVQGAGGLGLEVIDENQGLNALLAEAGFTRTATSKAGNER